jgi:RNA polymerase sigma-70 factor (ECF subfamily)
VSPAPPASHLDDAALIQAIAAGGREAFETLLCRYERSLLGFARTVSGSTELAEDVLQETFVSVWRSASTYRGEASARGWLYGIARNALRRQYRRRVGEPSALESFDALGSPDALGRAAGWGEADDGGYAARVESRLDLEAAFARLSPKDREILYLVDVEGLTHEEAGRLSDVGTGAVKTRVHRARLRLMAALRGGDDD